MDQSRKALSFTTQGYHKGLLAEAMSGLRDELKLHWPELPNVVICALGLIKDDGGIRVFFADGQCVDLPLDVDARAGVLRAAVPLFLFGNAMPQAVA